MSIGESVVVGLFTLALVFVVLAILYAMVMVLSAILGTRLNKKKEATEKTEPLAESYKKDWNSDIVYASTGELKLKNVDEKTAAMIMAIVSDESRIPLSELCFKSITAVE
jgi:Na+-transporting methylmalonyl-CoA/oxaloacetate decarboxylase gamma subunit